MSSHTNFVREVELPESGVVEFEAWENAKFSGVVNVRYPDQKEVPLLIFEDCPTRKQKHYRFLVLQGQAQVPLDERWVIMGCVWRTRKSYGTLYMSAQNVGAPKKADRKPKKAEPVPDEEVGQHVDAMAP